MKKHFYALECLLFLSFGCQKAKVLKNKESITEVRPTLSLEATRLKQKYEVQVSAYRDVAYVPELDWYRLQKWKGSEKYRVPLLLSDTVQNEAYLMIDEARDEWFYSTKIGTAEDHVIFFHQLEGNLAYFIFYKDGVKMLARLKDPNSKYNIHFGPNFQRYSIPPVEISYTYPNPWEIDWLGLIGGGDNWQPGGGGGNGGGEPPPPPDPNDPNKPPCQGDPIKEPSIAPSDINKTNYNGGRYGKDTRRYGDGRPKPHWGTDLAADPGTPVYAMYSGVVDFAGNKPGDYDGMSEFGNFINIVSPVGGEPILISYAHLSAINVKPGQVVQQGDIIGLSGTSGNANGPNIVPHVHIETRQQNNHNEWERFNPEEIMTTEFDANGKPKPSSGCK